MPNQPDTGEVDARAASTFDDLAVLLARLRLRHGDPSLRELVSRSLAAREQDRSIVPLSRTTISDVLNGRRTVGHDFLVAFLTALGLSARDQEPWVQARTRIAEAQLHPDPATTRAESPTPRPPRWPLSPWVLATGGVLAVLALTAVLRWPHDTSRDTTLTCVPVDCRTTDPRLRLAGRVTGPIAGSERIVLMTQVDSDGQWYLGRTVITDSSGEWVSDAGIGNPVPAGNDRHFLICAFALTPASIEGLTALMAASTGNRGISPAQLPADRRELACTRATRLKQG